MSITSTTAATGSSDLGGALGAGGTSALGKEEFLKLLTAQLRNQDPLQPIQNEQFVAQLAQFSSLEQMQNMNDNLTSNIMINQSVNNSLATTLIGREVEAKGNTFTLESGSKTNLSFTTSADASAKVEVVDSNGKVVATIKAGDLKAGNQSVSWDGNGADGKPAASGDYTFRVTATDAKGNAVGTQTMVRGKVTGVKFQNGGTYLMVGSRTFSLADVTQILDASATK